MAIQIPMYLVNQTGPQWDEFVKQAQKAGFAAADVGNVANEVFDNLINRKLVQSRQAVDKLADSFGKVDTQAGKLVGTVKYLNAMNITPRGYEMYAYRMSMLASNLGAATVPLAAVAGSAYVGVKAFQALLDKGDETAKELQGAFDRLSKSGGHFLESIGKTDVFQGGMRGLTDSVETLEDIMLRGTPTIKGFFAALTGNTDGMRAAKAEIDQINQAIEDTEVEARRKSAKKVFDKSEQRQKRKDYQGELSGISDQAELARREQAERERLNKAAERMDQEAFDATREEVEKNLLDIQNRKNELIREARKLNEDIQKAEKESADRDGRKDNPFRTQNDVKSELETEFRLAKEVTRTVEDRRKSLEKIKDLEKELAELQKQEAKNAATVTGFRRHQAEAARKDAEHKAKAAQHEEDMLRKLHQRHAEEERKKYTKAFTHELGDGGIQDLMNEMGEKNQKKIRAVIGNDRAQRQAAIMRMNQRQQLANFQGSPAQRAALQATQRNDMRRATQQARAQGFRDYNQGNISQDELGKAQNQVFRGLVQDAAKKGQISKEAARNAIAMASELQQQQAQVSQIQKDLDQTRRVLRGIQGTRSAAAAQRAALSN